MSSEIATRKLSRTKNGLWPPEVDQRLRAAYEAGRSTTAIACELGRSRSAVCGRAYRLGLKFTPKPGAGQQPEKTRGQERPLPGILRLRPAGRAYKLRTVAVDCNPKPLAQLGPRECRYCVKDADEGHMEQALFCAAAKEVRRSYCPAHQGLASLGRKDDVDALTLELASHLARGQF